MALVLEDKLGNCCHGNQLMGECLAKDMIEEANFSKFFSYFSDIQWLEIL